MKSDPRFALAVAMQIIAVAMIYAGILLLCWHGFVEYMTP